MIFILHLLIISNLITFFSAQVIQFDDGDFEERLLDYEHILVLFYSPDCVHCKTFLPEFEEAAKDLLLHEPSIPLGMVNCLDTGKHVCKQENLDELPTLMVYTRGEQTNEFDGKRTREAIVEYMKNLVAIVSLEKPLAECHKLRNSETVEEMSIVALLNKSKGSLRNQYFQLPPELGRSMKFIHCNTESYEEKQEIVLLRPKFLDNKFEPSKVTYKGRGYDLENWIRSKKHGIAGFRVPNNIDEFDYPLVIAYYSIDLKLNPKVFSYWRNRILKVAQDHIKDYTFAISPIEDFQQELNKFTIFAESSKKPIIFAILKDHTKYLMETEFSVKNFENFLEGLQQGTLDRLLRSQPIPAPDGELIKKAVARNFKKVVMENERDVLLVFFAPWCKHCQSMEQPLNEAAETLMNEDVDIVKMDGHANEIPPQFKVDGFPSIYFLSKDNQSDPIEYHEDYMSATSFVEFVAQHASKELKKFDRDGNGKTLHEEF